MTSDDYIHNNLCAIEEMRSGKHGQSEIYTFWRDPDNKFDRKMGKEKDFDPYMYVLEDEDIDIPKKKVKNVQPGFKTYDGRRAKKITFYNKDDRYESIEKFDESFEADVNLDQRYVIDKECDYIDDPRIHYVDIESDMSTDAENAPEPVVMICLYDNYLEKYFMWSWRGDFENKIEPDYQNESGEAEIRYFENEKDMFQDFLDFQENNRPDIMTGWYFKGYDMPYLINRMKGIKGVDEKRLSQLGWLFKSGEDWNIYGLQVMDMLEMYKKVVYKKPPDYQLSTIAEVVADDFPKLTHELSIGEQWRQDFKALVDYNLRDVELLVKIEEEKGLFEFLTRIQSLVPQPLEDVMHNSKTVDNKILHRFKGEKVFPTKEKGEREKAAGGYVFDPDPGLHENVIVLDVGAMYPSLITTFNISPDTIDMQNGTIEFKDDEVYPSGGIKFKDHTEKTGVLTEVVFELMESRYTLKQKRNEAFKRGDEKQGKKFDELQRSYKRVLNSFFGVFLFPGFRLHDSDVAKSITYSGRTLIKFAARYVEENYPYEVVYGDTDSIMVELGDIDDPVEEAESIAEEINYAMTDFCESRGVSAQDCTSTMPERVKEYKFDNDVHNLFFEAEALCETMFFPEVQKTYMGHKVWEGGSDKDELYVKGFDVIDRSTPEPIQEVLSEAYWKVLEKSSEREVKDFLIEAVEEALDSYGLVDLAIPRNLSKPLEEYSGNSQHVRAAKYSNEHLGSNFEKDNAPRIIYIRRTPPEYPSTDVLALAPGMELPDGFEVDWEKYRRKMIVKKMESIFEVLGWSKNLTQRSLIDYF